MLLQVEKVGSQDTTPSVKPLLLYLAALREALNENKAPFVADCGTVEDLASKLNVQVTDYYNRLEALNNHRIETKQKFTESFKKLPVIVDGIASPQRRQSLS